MSEISGYKCYTFRANFKECKREKNGNIILKKQLDAFLIPVSFMAIAVIPIAINYNSVKVNIYDAIFMPFFLASFLFLIKELYTVKVSANENLIVAYGIFGKRKIEVSSIVKITCSKWLDYTRLTSVEGSITVPFDMVGFVHFYRLLKARLGDYTCADITDMLQKRIDYINKHE